MRKFITLAAAVPLGLLAACGGASEQQEDSAVAGAGTELSTPDMAEQDMPQVAENGVENVDFSGDYTMAGSDGSQTRLTLDKAAGTYTYRGAGGTERSGNFRRLDNNRIMIEDFDGRAGYFSVADGAMYRLNDENTPYSEINVTGMYRRDNAPVQQSGPGATTDTVADKRGG